jgi:hypothetical protein
MKTAILLFESVHKVLKAEQVLITNQILHEIIPTPRDVSSSCGISIRVNIAMVDVNMVHSLLQQNGIEGRIFAD